MKMMSWSLVHFFVNIRLKDQSCRKLSRTLVPLDTQVTQSTTKGYTPPVFLLAQCFHHSPIIVAFHLISGNRRWNLSMHDFKVNCSVSIEHQDSTPNTDRQVAMACFWKQIYSWGYNEFGMLWNTFVCIYMFFLKSMLRYNYLCISVYIDGVSWGLFPYFNYCFG